MDTVEKFAVPQLPKATRERLSSRLK